MTGALHYAGIFLLSSDVAPCLALLLLAPDRGLAVLSPPSARARPSQDLHGAILTAGLHRSLRRVGSREPHEREAWRLQTSVRTEGSSAQSGRGRTRTLRAIQTLWMVPKRENLLVVALLGLGQQVPHVDAARLLRRRKRLLLLLAPIRQARQQ